MEAFSDGVFAIAITLLVLDISVPEASFDHLLHAIGAEWPAYLGFVTSFSTIARIWLGHHAIFRRLRFADSAVMRLNLLLLMAVSFLPFPTRLLSEAIHHGDAERIAVIFYGTTLFVTAILVNALWRAVRRDPELLEPEVTDAEAEAITVSARPNAVAYLGTMALAVFVPKVAAGYLPRDRDRRGHAGARRRVGASWGCRAR